MFNFIWRFFSFGMITCLRIAMAVTNNTYFMAMDIFVIMADMLHNTNHALPDSDGAFNATRNHFRQIAFTNHIRPSSSLSHTCTQTEECNVQAGNERGRSSNPDIFIYNLDSSKKLTITHKNINSNSMSMKSDYQNQSSKKKVKLSRIESIEYDFTLSASESEELSNSSLNTSSNMSIENDVSDGHILHFSHMTKDGNGCGPSAEENPSQNCENKPNDTVDEREGFEEDSQRTELLETKGGDVTCIHKTSSPIRKSTNFSLFDPCNQLEDTFVKTKFESEELSSETSEESSTFQVDETPVNLFDNTMLLNDSARRRLSLPASFNSSNKAASYFEAIKNKIEETIKNTSRHEKSMREIKYPVLSETFLARDNEDSKEVFSCSSYESLPVSEHLHNTFEKSTLFSLYREDFVSTSTPDFSSVDEFVEAVKKLKSTLSLSELIKYENPLQFTLSTGSEGEVKSLTRAESCKVVEAKISQEKDSVALDNSFGFKAIESLSPEHEIDHESCKRKSSCYDEKEMQQMIKSIFDKMIYDIEEDENMTEKLGINDLIVSECESNENFAETKSCSFKSTLTEPPQFQQDQTIVEIFDIRPFESQSGIDKIEVGSLDSKLTQRSQDESPEIAKSYEETGIDDIEVCSLDNKFIQMSQDESFEIAKRNEETSSPIPALTHEEISVPEIKKADQKRSELENTELIVRLQSDESCKFLTPKVSPDTKVHGNLDTRDQSFVTVTETDHESKVADLPSGVKVDDDRPSIATRLDNLEGDNATRVISTTCYQNNGLGNEDFLSFVEENSFYNDSNLEDSNWVLKELICK